MNIGLDTLRLPGFAPRNSKRPCLVAVEGPNGAGKTTLCRNLERSLKIPSALGVDNAWFAEPFKERMIRDAEWYASAMFFMSGCFEQMRTLLGRKEPLILMDRCLWSTLAVHAAHSTERLAVLLAMLEPIAKEIQVPDFTVILQASFATCQSRIAQKSGLALSLDKLTSNESFHQREHAFYQWLVMHVPGCLFLDVDHLTAEEAASRAEELIHNLVRC